MTIYARRHNPRFRLTEAANVAVGSEKSALVVDVCEAGLRFKTSSPCQDTGSVKLRLTSGESEGIADIVWLDDSHTTGGIRFKAVPPEIRDQIRMWIEESRRAGEKVPPVATRVSTVSPPADNSHPSVYSSITQATEPKRAAPPPPAKAAPQSEMSERVKATGASSVIHAGQRRTLAIFAADAASTERKKISRESSSGRRFALVVILVLVFFGAATAAAGHYYPSQAHDALSRAQSVVERVVTFARERVRS